MHWFLCTVVILILAKAVAELTLDGLNRKNVRQHADRVPETFRDWMDADTYTKSVSYTLAKSRFGSAENLFDTAWLVVILTSGLLPLLYEQFTQLMGTSVWAQAGTLILIGFILGLPSLPWEWASQFKLEARFGFNQSTLKLWISDKIKGLLLGLLIGVPLLSAIVFIVREYPETWWIGAAVLLFFFQVAMMVLYPLLILPLFNKLSPLQEGSLKARLMALAERAGFRANTIQVIDGSKRSSHSNAYFTGFGKFRRIVLYDTLMQQLSEEELESVLAHEIGHYKLGHIPKMIAIAAVSLFGSFWIIDTLMEQEWFYAAFGFPPNSGITVALLLFSLCSGAFTFWFSPLMHVLSRRHEYQADAFAIRHIDKPQAMTQSLRKLHEENLSNLTPHPLFSAIYFSHPTLIEREQAIQQQVQT